MLEEESSHPVGVIFYNYFSFMILIKYMLIINDMNERTLSTTFLEAEIIWVAKEAERSNTFRKYLTPLFMRLLF